MEDQRVGNCWADIAKVQFYGKVAGSGSEWPAEQAALVEACSRHAMAAYPRSSGHCLAGAWATQSGSQGLSANIPAV